MQRLLVAYLKINLAYVYAKTRLPIRHGRQEGALVDLLFALNLRRELLDQPSRCRLCQRSEHGPERRLSLLSLRHLHRAPYRFASRN